MRKLFSTQIFALFFIICAAQKSPVKFGKIVAEDFNTKVYKIDSNATAAIIADIGYSEIVGNNKGWFSIDFRRFKRMQILKQSAYELANIEIPLYTDGSAEEQLQNLKAYTYNLENGKVVETKLEVKSALFREKIDKNHVLAKFTFPAIKEGSIIEFDYTIQSDFIFNLQPWEFQGAYPTLWSEYEVSIPEFFYYVFLSQGIDQSFVKTQNSSVQNFRIKNDRSVSADTYSFTASVNRHRIVMKDVPALKEENFTTTLSNHIAKLEFQLAELRQPLVPKNIMRSWDAVCNELLKDENFGLQLSRDNNWMSDDIKIAVGNGATELEKAKNIFNYVQKNFTCTGYNRKYTDQPLKNIFRDKKGSEAEINLILIAMLRKAGITADPVMLSTRSNGYVYPVYPIMDRFNYVACQAKTGGKTIYLDASRPRLGFGKLHWECFNGHARVINAEATPLEFSPDSLIERKITSLMLFTSDKGELEGNLQQTPGYYESYSLRNKIKENGQEEFFKEVKKNLGPEFEISDASIDSLDKYDEIVQINYNVKLNLDKGDVIYLNPVFGEGYKENPFKSAQRLYPVEMPYTFDEIFSLRMDVPQGYVVDELPKSIRVNFDESGTSFFEYIIVNTDGAISLRSRVKLIRSYFLPEEYDILREFFNLIVNKHNEQVVFKKKK